MAKRVLVAIDDSGPATAALEYALSRFSTADITVLHVLDIVDADDMRQWVLPTDCDEQRDAAEHTAETVLRTARTYAEASGIEITTATTVGRPARQILTYAEENDIDRIVMGTHGRFGLARLLLGSLSDLVSGQSSVPVTSVPKPITTEPAGTSSRESLTQDHGDPNATAREELPLPFWWCPDCAVTLHTRVEFCPGCLEVLLPAGTSN